MAVRGAVRAALDDLPDGSSVLAGVSGGADSLALAAALAWVAQRQNLRAGAVCVDHGLQAGSAQVAAAAAEVCRGLGLDPVEVVPVEVAGDSREGPEAAARRVRYQALAASADRHGAAAVLLGHTRDDQAEQVLLGLVRGSGVRSLAGIPPRRGQVRRPLLQITREQTEASCAELDLTPWRDPHNDDDAFTRVRVRRALRDLESDLGPGIRDALARTAEQVRADADLLDKQADDAARHLGAPPWSVGKLTAYPDPIRTRLWRRLLIAAGAPAGQVSSRHTDECDRLVTAWHGQGPIHVPGGLLVRSTGEVVRVERYGVN
ncbi:tRNA lysidine(34) synthetase TilS [Nostocoides veronense]|uniref:tRNA(Ile)-lysidine synthase n=2 Tax=Nostocoides veronense TaxID=330836 RepID=A0ABN2L9N1_9MICO